MKSEDTHATICNPRNAGGGSHTELQTVHLYFGSIVVNVGANPSGWYVCFVRFVPCPWVCHYYFAVIFIILLCTSNVFLLQDPTELKRVTRVKPIDSFSARWDAIVERVLAAPRQPEEQPHVNGGPSESSLPLPSSSSSSAPPNDSCKFASQLKVNSFMHVGSVVFGRAGLAIVLINALRRFVTMFVHNNKQATPHPTFFCVPLSPARSLLRYFALRVQRLGWWLSAAAPGAWNWPSPCSTDSSSCSCRRGAIPTGWWLRSSTVGVRCCHPTTGKAHGGTNHGDFGRFLRAAFVDRPQASCTRQYTDTTAVNVINPRCVYHCPQHTPLSCPCHPPRPPPLAHPPSLSRM